MALLVVRHAHAGERAGWSGDDRLRPLSETGRKQAAELANALVVHHPSRVLSSPAVRCITTVEPLAERLGLAVVADERLREGASPADVTSLLAEVDGATVLCSHGDVIPLLLRQLTDAGMTPAQGLRWSKASTWVVERDGDRWGAGAYVAPPAI